MTQEEELSLSCRHDRNSCSYRDKIRRWLLIQNHRRCCFVIVNKLRKVIMINESKTSRIKMTNIRSSGTNQWQSWWNLNVHKNDNYNFKQYNDHDPFSIEISRLIVELWNTTRFIWWLTIWLVTSHFSRLILKLSTSSSILFYISPFQLYPSHELPRKSTGSWNHITSENPNNKTNINHNCKRSHNKWAKF